MVTFKIQRLTMPIYLRSGHSKTSQHQHRFCFGRDLSSSCSAGVNTIKASPLAHLASVLGSSPTVSDERPTNLASGAEMPPEVDAARLKCRAGEMRLDVTKLKTRLQACGSDTVWCPRLHRHRLKGLSAAFSTATSRRWRLKPPKEKITA